MVTEGSPLQFVLSQYTTASRNEKFSSSLHFLFHLSRQIIDLLISQVVDNTTRWNGYICTERGERFGVKSYFYRVAYSLAISSSQGPITCRKAFHLPPCQDLRVPSCWCSAGGGPGPSSAPQVCTQTQEAGSTLCSPRLQVGVSNLHT